MDSVIFHWVMSLIILIILTILTDISTACLITTFIMIIEYITQHRKKYSIESKAAAETKHSSVVKQHTTSDVETKHSSVVTNKTPDISSVDPQLLIDNAEMLESVLNPKLYSTDDRIFDVSVVSGYKDKKAKEIRSHWNNDNWKRYYDYEFGIHETENREWWTDNDYEISKKHIVI